MKKRQSSSSLGTQKRNQYTFSIDDQRNILISSNFQSGNIALLKQINELYYVLEALPDIENTQSKKSWFYFKINSQKGIKVRLIIQNVNIYQYIFQDRIYCKPMMKEGQNGSWMEVPQSFLTYRDELSLVIDHTFKSQEDVYFCLSVPFTYAQNQVYLQKIKQGVHQNISYDDQILAETPNGNQVHLLTITQKSQNQNLRETVLSEDRKPVVLVTARVHPGQVSSTFCLQGILQMLLDYKNLQSYLLRRLFVFKIIPILNPDGVIQGNYRMDPQGFNLNRFYLQPNQQQHPAIYSVLQLIKTLGVKQRIEFYFDLHSHSSIKQSFIYGNALQDIVNQTYSQSFCKILQQNFPRFRYSLSNFDQQHMKHKDRGQSLSKQGCGRVVINKLCGVVCSYTLQSSVFPSSYGNFIKKNPKNNPNNTAFIYYIKQNSFQFKSLQEQSSENIFVSQNKLLGKSILISLLDMVNKNPFSRFKDNANQSIVKQIALKLLQNEERFKLMDIKANQKVKMIHQFIKNKFQGPLNKQWNLTKIYEQINKITWPQEFKPIIVFEQLFNHKQNKNAKFLKARIKTDGKQKINISSSLKKGKKTENIPTFKKVEIEFAQSHRSISPHHPTSIFPEIKYSVEMKVQSKGSIDTKSGLVKQMNLNIEQHEIRKVKKRMIIDYINEEITKITPDKQLLKKKDSSLNRLITNKIIEKEKCRQKHSQMNQYKNIMVQSRKRITTECKEQTSNEGLNQTKIKSKYELEDQSFKGLELRKAQIIKKRFMLTNKAVQILKKADKSKIKLPEVSKINLIIQNSKKEKAPLDNKKSFQKITSNSIQT